MCDEPAVKVRFKVTFLNFFVLEIIDLNHSFIYILYYTVHFIAVSLLKIPKNPNPSTSISSSFYTPTTYFCKGTGGRGEGR